MSGLSVRKVESLSKRNKKLQFIRQNQQLSISELTVQTGLSETEIIEVIAIFKAEASSRPTALSPFPFDKHSLWKFVLFLIFPVFLFYLPVLNNDFVNWDDQQTIIDNTHIRSLNFSSIHWMLTTNLASYWIPLTWLSLAFDFFIGGMNPKIFHFTNLFLHVLNSGLVFFVCLRILNFARKSREAIENKAGVSFEIPVAFLTAILFGLHPIHVESVAWATERKDVLYSFFYLLSLLFYVKYSPSGGLKGSRFYACLGFFFLALMSKPMAVTLPLIFLTLDWWPLRRFQDNFFKVLIEKTPFFVVALLVGLATLTLHPEGIVITENFSMAFRIMNAFRSLVFYLWKMILPLNLVPLYPVPQLKDGAYYMGNYLSIFLIILVSGACYYFRKKAPYLTVAWLFYLVTLAPVLGILQVGVQAAADRYTYISSLGFFLPFSAWAVALTRNRRMLLAIFSVILIGTLGFATVGQIGVWKNSQTLWENVIKVYPDDSQIAHKNLATAYQLSGRLDDALREYEKAILIPPPMASAHSGRGTILFEKGRKDEAIQEFKYAISLEPNYLSPRRNLAVCYERMGMHDAAVAEMQTADKIARENAEQ